MLHKILLKYFSLYFQHAVLKFWGLMITRACSTSQKGIVEYLEMGPQQNEAMVPTVTALVAARVPDITTSLLILKDLKRSEVINNSSLSWDL